VPKDKRLLHLRIPTLLNPILQLNIKIPQKIRKNQFHLCPSQILANAISWSHSERLEDVSPVIGVFFWRVGKPALGCKGEGRGEVEGGCEGGVLGYGYNRLLSVR